MSAVSRNKLKMRIRKVRDVPYGHIAIFFKITFFYVATYAAICIVCSVLLVKTRPECPLIVQNLYLAYLESPEQCVVFNSQAVKLICRGLRCKEGETGNGMSIHENGRVSMSKLLAFSRL
jgi:hypothetical protein